MGQRLQSRGQPLQVHDPTHDHRLRCALAVLRRASALLRLPADRGPWTNVINCSPVLTLGVFSRGFIHICGDPCCCNDTSERALPDAGDSNQKPLQTHLGCELRRLGPLTFWSGYGRQGESRSGCRLLSCSACEPCCVSVACGLLLVPCDAGGLPSGREGKFCLDHTPAPACAPRACTCVSLGAGRSAVTCGSSCQRCRR